MKRWTISFSIKLWLAAAIPAICVGCGSSLTPTAPSFTPQANNFVPAPQPGNIVSAATDTVPAATDGVAGAYRLDVTMARSGTAAVTLLWPDADISLQLYLTTGDCTSATNLVGGTCTILGVARPGNPPLMVSAPVTSGDLNTVWVLNPDPFSQAVTIALALN